MRHADRGRVAVLIAAELARCRRMFVQPHFDDIALSCGGTVARHEAEGTTIIVTVFTQRPPAEQPIGQLARVLHEVWGDPVDPWPRRRAEDDGAAARLGAGTLWLGEHDAIYREHYGTAAALRNEVHPADEALAARVTERLVSTWRQTARASVYLPLAVGGHVDHRICFRAGAALAEAGAAVSYYEDFPYLLTPGALDARLQILRSSGRWTSTEMEVTETIEARIEAILEYRSQLGALFRPGGNFPTDWQRALRDTAAARATRPGGAAERFWRQVSGD